MPMNKQKGNMYEWITHTWNPLAGECPHKCFYCSTKRLKNKPVLKAKYSGDIRLIEKELETNLGEDNTIFVCAQNDLFSWGVEMKIIIKILKHCHKYSKNTYLFQSKNPERFMDYYFPKNTILGTTIESDNNYKISKAPNMWNRISAMERIYTKKIKKMITIEPIFDFDIDELFYMINIAKPDIINIGSLTGFKNSPIKEPTAEKITKLTDMLKDYNVLLKGNLNRLLKK